MFSVENRKSEDYHRIQDIQIYINTKFHLIQATFTFLARFVQKGRKELVYCENHCIRKILSSHEIQLLSLINSSVNIH